jgi:serine/threonine protein kinase
VLSRATTTGGGSIATERLLSGRYELGPLLGRGGMSEVHRGKDTTLDRRVAIKLLRGDGDKRSVTRFEREAQVLARLQHPNIVTVFDVGADESDRFIVMELVEGPTLREVLNTTGRLEPHRAASIAGGIAAALAYAHAQDVVHRDVKPSNVLIASEDQVKLADLGIAKLLSAEPLTATTGVIGSAQYIAPEQARGDLVDGRADLYSLGCVLFEMLVGRPPFEGDAGALTYAHVHRPAPRARSLAPDVPGDLDQLVAALLEKQPSARPQDAEEVRIVLERATERDGGPTISTQQLTSPEPRKLLRQTRLPRRRWIGAAAAATLVAVLLLVLLPVLIDGDQTPDGGADTRSPQASAESKPSEPSPEPSGPPPEPPSSQEAAQHVFDVVSEGIAAGEVTGGIVGDVQHKIDEAFKELEEHQDLEKALDKVEELQEKVIEAREKGEITSQARVRAINDALDEFAAALEADV